MRSNAHISNATTALYSSKSRERMTVELAEHIKKAVSPDETAPKPKHVRAIILYTHAWKTSAPFWSSLRLLPVLADEIQCFKALIVVHKIVVGGAGRTVVGEAAAEGPFLDSTVRAFGSGNNLGRGYGQLIREYVRYLKVKMAFHKQHSDFTGSFDYDEWVSLRGVGNPDEGYQTVSELLELAGKLDSFVRIILASIGSPTAPNQCRVSALVPFVEESYGIFHFATSMLSALHLSVPSADPLLPLVDLYHHHFFPRLSQFYAHCRQIPYLTSLMTIPDLPPSAPTFDVDGRQEIARLQPPGFGSTADSDSCGHSPSRHYQTLDTVNMAAPNVNRHVIEEANEQLMRLGVQLQESIDRNIEKDAVIEELQAVQQTSY